MQAAPKVSISLNLIAASSALARGNENNAHQPDGLFFLGTGRSPAYAVVNAGAHYTLTRQVQLVAQINTSSITITTRPRSWGRQALQAPARLSRGRSRQ
jgi:hypothetical protein